MPHRIKPIAACLALFIVSCGGGGDDGTSTRVTGAGGSDAAGTAGSSGLGAGGGSPGGVGGSGGGSGAGGASGAGASGGMSGVGGSAGAASGGASGSQGGVSGTTGKGGASGLGGVAGSAGAGGGQGGGIAGSAGSQGGVSGSAGGGAGGSTGGGAGTSGVGGTGGVGAGGTGGNSVVPPSCQGLPAACGSTATDDCCAPGAPLGGSFHLGRRPRDPDGPCSVELTCYDEDEVPGADATLSPVRLDRYEITVGRFRKFIDAVVGGWTPPAGSGKHAHLPAGGLAGETGWDKAWPKLPATKAVWDTLLTDDRTTWTPSPTTNEDLPLNNISWYETYAFCIWDGGFLPTTAEWEYVATGGSEERVLPWSNPPSSVVIDDMHAAYYCPGPGGLMPACSDPKPVRVGSLPLGNGKWGHADLGGNLWEWILDWSHQAPYPPVCNDCVDLDPKGTTRRRLRGSSFGSDGWQMRVAWWNEGAPGGRIYAVGGRCARSPLFTYSTVSPGR